MRVLLKHICLASLPLLFGLAAGWGFAYLQGSCGALVGPIFAAKCHGRQLEYQLLFQTGGTVLGCLVAATLGAKLELRRGRAVPQAPTTGEPS